MASKTIRVYFGTRKGGYATESDSKRRKSSVRGPFQPGKDVFHVAPDPRHPGTVYSAANSGSMSHALPVDRPRSANGRNSRPQ